MFVLKLYSHRFAIKKGYRHIDCAKVYLNEKEVGEVFEGIIDKEVPRKELFIVGKVEMQRGALDLTLRFCLFLFRSPSVQLIHCLAALQLSCCPLACGTLRKASDKTLRQTLFPPAVIFFSLKCIFLCKRSIGYRWPSSRNLSRTILHFGLQSRAATHA